MTGEMQEYGPSAEELRERIFALLMPHAETLGPDSVREIGGAVDTLVDYAGRPE